MATLEQRKTEYDTHKTAGYDYYNGFRSQLTLDVEATTKTLEQCLIIESRFKKVSESLLNGDWKSALVHVGNVKPNVFLDQSLIDQVSTDIQNYITANYSW